MATRDRITFRGAGVDLAAEAEGPLDGQPILFLHGSGQTRQSWSRALAQAARRGFRGIAMDMRGHGDSGWSPDGKYDLTVFADDLSAVLTQFERPPIVVGASLGGLTGMFSTVAAPERVKALVLVDITAKIEMDGAQEVIDFMASGLKGFDSLEEAAEAVAAYLPHRPKPSSTDGLARNLRLRDGRYYWHWDPAFRRMGQSEEERASGPNRLEEAARALTIPTLLVRGGRSRIVSEEGARHFLELVPHAEFVDIADAHHMVAGDANDAFNQAIFDFAEKQAAQPPVRSQATTALRSS